MTDYQPYTPGAGSVPEKPGMLTAVSVLTLISGITNILAGLTWTVTLIVTVVGICITPLALLPIVLGIFEIIYASKLLANPVKSEINQTIAILEIIGILSGNILSLVAGILSLVARNDTAVKEYYASVGLPVSGTTPMPM